VFASQLCYSQSPYSNFESARPYVTRWVTSLQQEFHRPNNIDVFQTVLPDKLITAHTCSATSFNGSHALLVLDKKAGFIELGASITFTEIHLHECSGCEFIAATAANNSIYIAVTRPGGWLWWSTFELYRADAPYQLASMVRTLTEKPSSLAMMDSFGVFIGGASGVSILLNDSVLLACPLSHAVQKQKRGVNSNRRKRLRTLIDAYSGDHACSVE
jgi:hypothetical protein